MAKTALPDEVAEPTKAPEPAGASTQLRTFPSLAAPDGAALGTLMRERRDGSGSDRCRILDQGVWHEQFPPAMLTEETIPHLWGSGRYRVMWHDAANKAAGRSKLVAFEDPKRPEKPADFRPPDAPQAAPPPPERVTRRALPRIPEGVPADVALMLYVQAEERAESRFEERERAREREHERAMEREQARHLRHMDVERQGFEFLLRAAATQATPPPVDPRLFSGIQRELRTMGQRIEEIDVGGEESAEEPLTPMERMLDKYLPAGIAAIQEVVKMAAARQPQPAASRTVRPAQAPADPVDAVFRPDEATPDSPPTPPTPPQDRKRNDWGASS